MTTASLLYFCSDSLPDPMISGHLSRRKAVISGDPWLPQMRFGRWVTGQIRFNTHPSAQKLQCWDLLTLLPYSQVVLMNFRDEQPRTGIRLLCCCFCFECVLDWESQSTDLSTPGSKVTWVTGHDFWCWLCQSVLSSPGGGNSICWCPGSHLLIRPRGYCEILGTWLKLRSLRFSLSFPQRSWFVAKRNYLLCI